MAFGDVWKESLTELSGGQRSLLALSLILAMLLFKPAPIYILDEVRLRRSFMCSVHQVCTTQQHNRLCLAMQWHQQVILRHLIPSRVLMPCGSALGGLVPQQRLL